MRKVLVIEDNPDNLKIMRYALERAGYQVLASETGEEGFRLALAERPVFIVMDINLPGMDGIATTRCIRESAMHSSIPIIAITSHAMHGNREQMLAAGCDGYIEKPIDPITVVAEIHRILGLEWEMKPS